MSKTTLKERLLKKLNKSFEELGADCERQAEKHGYHDVRYDLARGRLQNMLDVIKMVKRMHG